MVRKKKPTKVVPPANPSAAQPQFSQPTTSPDPSKFTVAHGNDNPLYKKVQKSL